MQLAVFAATVTTSVVFFPVFLLNGVSKYIFTDLAYGVVFSIFASYLFSMTLVPLFCAKFIHPKANEDSNEEALHVQAWVGSSSTLSFAADAGTI